VLGRCPACARRAPSSSQRTRWPLARCVNLTTDRDFQGRAAETWGKVAVVAWFDTRGTRANGLAARTLTRSASEDFPKFMPRLRFGLVLDRMPARSLRQGSGNLNLNHPAVVSIFAQKAREPDRGCAKRGVAPRVGVMPYPAPPAVVRSGPYTLAATLRGASCSTVAVEVATAKRPETARKSIWRNPYSARTLERRQTHSRSRMPEVHARQAVTIFRPNVFYGIQDIKNTNDFVTMSYVKNAAPEPRFQVALSSLTRVRNLTPLSNRSSYRNKHDRE
jgi:hypothetical protein